MAKSRTRRQRKNAATSAQRSNTTAQPVPLPSSSAASTTQMRRVKTVRKVQSAQSLILPGMVALGCWGLAFSFTFLTTSQNHLVFGVMSALMALMWSVNLGLRVRKVLH